RAAGGARRRRLSAGVRLRRGRDRAGPALRRRAPHPAAGRLGGLRRAPRSVVERRYLRKQPERSGAPIKAPRPTQSREATRPLARLESAGSLRVASVALTVSKASPVPNRTTIAPS